MININLSLKHYLIILLLLISLSLPTYSQDSALTPPTIKITWIIVETSQQQIEQLKQHLSGKDFYLVLNNIRKNGQLEIVDQSAMKLKLNETVQLPSRKPLICNLNGRTSEEFNKYLNSITYQDFSGSLSFSMLDNKVKIHSTSETLLLVKRYSDDRVLKKMKIKLNDTYSFDQPYLLEAKEISNHYPQQEKSEKTYIFMEINHA